MSDSVRSVRRRLPPFDAARDCPKCGGSDVGTRYIAKDRRESGDMLEAVTGIATSYAPCAMLLRTCRRCYFDWAECPLDEVAGSDRVSYDHPVAVSADETETREHDEHDDCNGMRPEAPGATFETMFTSLPDCCPCCAYADDDWEYGDDAWTRVEDDDGVLTDTWSCNGCGWCVVVTPAPVNASCDPSGTVGGADVG